MQLNLDAAVAELLATEQAKPQYPKSHEAAMPVPKGGSSCSSCQYLGKDSKTCINKYFIRWHGSNVLPYPPDEFCSDWYEPKEEIEAYGTSDGAKKGWDVRGRSGKFFEDLRSDSSIQPHPENRVDLAHNKFLVGYNERTGRANAQLELSKLGEDLVRLNYIEAYQKKSGEGSKALQRLTNLADKHGITMELNASPVGEEGLGREQLFEFYKKHGFERQPDFSGVHSFDGSELSSTMVRKPRKIEAYGTSEGVSKAWDTRGRGQHKELTVSADAPSHDKPVVLVFGGSYNPPHVGHVGATQDAAELMAKAGYKVDKIIIAPTADKLLLGKLGDRMYPLAERTELLRRTFPADVEVTSGPAEEAENYQGKLRRTQLADWVGKKYPDHTIVNITGEDSAPGHPPAFPSLYAGDKGSNHEGHYYLAISRPPGGLSSTKIRDALHRGEKPEGMTPEAYKYIEEVHKHHPEIVFSIDLDAAIVGLLAHGTSEGVTKAWDTRGRGRHEALEMHKGVRRMSDKDVKQVGKWMDMATRIVTSGRTLSHEQTNAMRKAANIGQWIAQDWKEKKEDKDDNQFFVVESPEHGIVGAINIVPSGSSGYSHVSSLASRPDVIAGLTEERGVGTKLMLQAARYAASRGDGLDLSALSGAEGFYQKLGMRQSVQAQGGKLAEFEWSPAEVKEFAKGTVN